MKQALNSLLSRRMLAACAAVAAVAGASLVGGTPAQARDYAYCLTSPGYGYPGDCSYSSYRQCRAAASGRLADCNLNPRVGFREPRDRDYRTYGDTRW